MVRTFPPPLVDEKSIKVQVDKKSRPVAVIMAQQPPIKRHRGHSYGNAARAPPAHPPPPAPVPGSGAFNYLPSAADSSAAGPSAPSNVGGNGLAGSDVSWAYISKERLDETSPSRRDGMSKEEEERYRSTACKFLKDLGKELHLPVVKHPFTVVVAQTLFHRFFARQSFKQFDRFEIVATALFLAAKVQESDKANLSKILKKYIELRKVQTGVQKEKILVYERILLHTIAFDIYVDVPFEKLKDLCVSAHQRQISVSIILWLCFVSTSRPFYFYSTIFSSPPCPHTLPHMHPLSHSCLYGTQVLTKNISLTSFI